MKKLFSLALCICMLCLMALPATASAGDERALEYTHINTITANLTIDRFWGIASCDGSIDASGNYPVCVDVYLQQKIDDNWVTLEVFSSEGQMFADTGGRYAIAKGYQYRAYTAGYVYDDNGTIIDAASAVYAVTY